MKGKGAAMIGVLGGGGQADELQSYLSNALVQFIALDKEYLDPQNPKQIDILQPNQKQRLLPVIAAVGAPALRKRMVETWPGKHYAMVISNTAYINRGTSIGEGSIIAPHSVITTNVKIGRHSIINVSASVSHNCKLGDYTTISPGARLAGNVTLGNGVFIGIGAVISNNVRIADGVVIGAGAVVLHDIEIPNSVYIGNPSRLLRHNDGWLNEL